MNPLQRLRIVSLAPSATSILCALGAHSTLIAVTRWCKDVVPAEAIQGLPVLDDCWNVDSDKVAELKPDLVIGSVPYRTEVIAGLLARGLRFLAKSPRTLVDIYNDTRLLARIVGKETEGEQLAGSMQSHVERIRQQAAAVETRSRVYCEVWSNPLRTCEHWVAELVEAAGGEFVPLPAGRQVTSEEIVAGNPEIIILAWAATGDRSRPGVIRKRPGWESISAIRKNRIHVVRDELLNTPSPILLDGLKALAAIIHPEIFKGVCSHPAP